MRVYLTPCTDPWERKCRAKTLLAEVKRYGLTPVSDGADHFDVELPRSLNPNQLSDFLRELGATPDEHGNPTGGFVRGVDIKADDVTSSSIVPDHLLSQIVAERMTTNTYQGEGLLPEDVLPSLNAWTMNTMTMPEQMTEEQEEEAYQKIMSMLPNPEDLKLKTGPRENRSLDNSLDESDQWLRDNAHLAPRKSAGVL
jgi:hypothetical protein